ncbi:DUF6427 family protein [Croceivirga thetidis]|nr:DUF6427 family protein [Croceivirga thetidis]
MISRFFEGTKPINYVVLLSFLFGFFVFRFYVESLQDQISIDFLNVGVSFIFLVLQIYLVNEIARKANLTETSTFPLLFFILLITAFSEVLLSSKLILSNFFVLLSVQEILTVDTSKRNNFNFFNASFWICIASIFYTSTILFFIPILFSIFFYAANNLRNWLMPLAAIVAFSLISVSIGLLFSSSEFFRQHYTILMPEGVFEEFNFESYTRLTLYVLANVILLFIVFGRLRAIGKGRVLELRMLFLFFIVGIILTLISLGPELGLGAILFTFCPVSLFITNYFQIFRRKRLKEYVLLFVIIAPISISIWKLFS